MEFRELSTFLQVAKLQSFSKAAKVLGYSQAAVTIRSLDHTGHGAGKRCCFPSPKTDGPPVYRDH